MHTFELIMNKVVVLFCLFASALGYILEPEALEKVSENSLGPNGRIVGGVKTDIRDVPYQVALELLGFQFCGGVLVSQYYVLTAGHCLSSADNRLTVRLGSSKRQKGGILLPVEYVRTHDGFFDMDTLDYDIGIIRLLKRAPLGKRIRPIRVANREAPPGTILRVSGWGLRDEHEGPSENLYSVKVRAISREKCEKVYAKTERKITNRMMCAYSERRDACLGDSGGAAVYKGVVYGLVGWGKGCARPGYPGVYTNVAESSIRKFIRDYAKV